MRTPLPFRNAPIAGRDFSWKHIEGYFMCVLFFDALVEMGFDGKIGSPILNAYGFLYVELPNPDVDRENRILSLPVENKKDYKSLYSAAFDKGLMNGENEFIVVYQHRRNLLRRPKPCFHIAIYEKGIFDAFFEKVSNYESHKFSWPEPLVLFQPHSRSVFPKTSNLIFS